MLSLSVVRFTRLLSPHDAVVSRRTYASFAFLRLYVATATAKLSAAPATATQIQHADRRPQMGKAIIELMGRGLCFEF